MDLQVHYYFCLYEHILQDVRYKFQLTYDTYQILSRIIYIKWALKNNLTNFWLWVYNNHTCDHLVDASIKILGIESVHMIGVLIYKYHLIYILKNKRCSFT